MKRNFYFLFISLFLYLFLFITSSSSGFYTPISFYETDFINPYFQLITITVSMKKTPSSFNNRKTIKSLVAISTKSDSHSYFRVITIEHGDI